MLLQVSRVDVTNCPRPVDASTFLTSMCAIEYQTRVFSNSAHVPSARHTVTYTRRHDKLDAYARALRLPFCYAMRECSPSPLSALSLLHCFSRQVEELARLIPGDAGGKGRVVCTKGCRIRKSRWLGGRRELESGREKRKAGG